MYMLMPWSQDCESIHESIHVTDALHNIPDPAGQGIRSQTFPGIHLLHYFSCFHHGPQLKFLNTQNLSKSRHDPAGTVLLSPVPSSSQGAFELRRKPDIQSHPLPGSR